ncbi:hypothetical protein D3C77_279460 [compost metagenome]
MADDKDKHDKPSPKNAPQKPSPRTAEEIKQDINFDAHAVKSIMKIRQHVKIDPKRMLDAIRRDIDPGISKILPDD